MNLLTYILLLAAIVLIALLVLGIILAIKDEGAHTHPSGFRLFGALWLCAVIIGSNVTLALGAPLQSPRAASAAIPGTQAMTVIVPPPTIAFHWTNAPGYGALIWSGTNLVSPTWVMRQWCDHNTTNAAFPRTNAAEYFRTSVEPDGLVVPEQ